MKDIKNSITRNSSRLSVDAGVIFITSSDEIYINIHIISI